MLRPTLHANTPSRLARRPFGYAAQLLRPPLGRLAHLHNNAAILTAAAVLSVFAGLAAIFSGWYVQGFTAAISAPLLILLLAAHLLDRTDSDRRQLSDEVDALRNEAAAVAHDLRSPLVTVRSYIELVDQGSYGPLPPEARRALERAVDASTRAQTLVESTLRRYRGDHAQPAHTGREVIELDSVVRDVRISLAAQLATSGARLDIDPLPAALGEHEALVRVFQNLVDNALKHAVPGSVPRIRIGASLIGARCEIEVRDWGSGIPNDKRERVFTRYERGTQSTGSGIGLATVRQIVEQHGGQVWIDPEVTTGLSIRISLPAPTLARKAA